jgi:hypothetical protein
VKPSPQTAKLVLIRRLTGFAGSSGDYYDFVSERHDTMNPEAN